MDVEVRGERPGDEEAIDIVNCRAFEEMGEPNLVRMLRQYYPPFDRRYSVTAWDGEEMVGHALFNPVRIRLTGQTVLALMVGPVAVVPERQRTGIGGELLRYGHELGRRDGYAVSFLYGHPSYYPRHGYRACFGVGKVSIDPDKLPPAGAELERWPVRPADVPWLVERYAAEWADVDFAPLWGSSLCEWTLPSLNALMWRTADGRRAAYTVDQPGRGRCRMLLADDPALAREVLATIRPKTLSHHPSGWLARHALDSAWAKVEAEPIEAAMACELRQGVLDPYLQAVASRSRPAGFALGPVAFLAC